MKTKAEIKQVLAEVVEIINESMENSDAAEFRDLISALRGPDNRNFELKQRTTAVIRHAIGVTGESGLDVNYVDSFMVYDDLLKQFGEQWQLHHRHHYLRALTGLRTFGYVQQDGHRDMILFKGV